MTSHRPTRLFELLEARSLLSTYYVSPTGNDIGPGASGQPWRTLQHAADNVAAGDTVLVQAGNYTGFDLRTSGTANARIVFKAPTGAVINQVNSKTNKDGINVENASYVTIDGFTLVGTNDPATSRAGIRVVGDGFDQANSFSKGVVVQNCSADRWGQWGIFTAFSDDMIIQNNVCSRSAQQHGIYFSNSADRPIIRNNTCWGNAACGIHVNADVETGNTDLPGVDGIITGALIDGNTCWGNGVAGGSAINCDGVQNSRIVNNVLYDNHSTGIALFQIDGAAPSTGDVVANNTIIGAADSRFCLLINNGATNTTVFNNILFNLHPTRGAIELSPDSASGLVCDYNFVEDRFSLNDTFVSLAQWRSGTGQDMTSVAISQAAMQALFTNYAGNDFSLANGSAAIDQGAPGLQNGQIKFAPSNDRVARVRPGGGIRYDVGAYEADTFATSTSGVLSIYGTGSVDSISLTLANGVYSATRNNITETFPAAGVTQIHIRGDAGDDYILIGAGVTLGAYIEAGDGNDYIQGGDGIDTITAGAGKDRVFGGLGDDRLNGNGGHDYLHGEAGKDRLYGGDGNDTLDGGSSTDRLWGEAGNNIYYGQGGDDYLYARNGASDTLYGQAGVDHAQLDASGDVYESIEELLA